MEHRETKLESQMIYEGKILRLRKDTVRLENGHTTIREVIDHSGGVSIVALDENDCLYMVRQYRYPSDSVLLELPAGKLEPGEDPETCGRRELEEECGCIADQFHLSGPYLSRYFKDQMGMNFADYLCRLRIAQAKELMKDSSLSIQEISARVGYNSSNSFIRTFKRYESVTPGQFRETLDDVKFR